MTVRSDVNRTGVNVGGHEIDSARPADMVPPDFGD
jgi:hypothetical protein